MSFQALLDNTADFQREVETTDSQGGYTTTMATLYRRVKCRFENVSRDRDHEIIAYDKSTVFPDFYLYIEHLSGIREGDRVIKDGRTWEIKLIENWSEQDKYMRLALVELGRNV